MIWYVNVRSMLCEALLLSPERLWIKDCSTPEDRLRIFARFNAFQSMEGVVAPFLVKFISAKLAAT